MSKRLTFQHSTMARIPMSFRRISAAFDDDVARARLCGSEQSAAASSVTDDDEDDLSDLVDFFFQRVDDQDVELEACGGEERENELEEDSDGEEERGSGSIELEEKEMLISLIGGGAAEETAGGRRVRRKIQVEVEMALRSFGDNSPQAEGFKRGLTSWLRQKGFDAGLCKSRWDKTARHPAGEYEYIDIVTSKTRYIVEVYFTNEFMMARQSDHYSALLQLIPQVVVCKEGQMKQLVRLMCTAMRQSLKKVDMHVPPWRRNGYVYSKWFGVYKRTTNTVSKATSSHANDLAGRSLVGFEASPVRIGGCNCGGEVAIRKVGLHVGNLKAVLNGMP